MGCMLTVRRGKIEGGREPSSQTETGRKKQSTCPPGAGPVYFRAFEVGMLLEDLVTEDLVTEDLRRGEVVSL